MPPRASKCSKSIAFSLVKGHLGAADMTASLILRSPVYEVPEVRDTLQTRALTPPLLREGDSVQRSLELAVFTALRSRALK